MPLLAIVTFGWLESVKVEAIQRLNRLRSPNRLVIFPTINSGYGTKAREIFCTEETPLEPISLYGQTKGQIENLLLQTSNVISLRLATVFGMSFRMKLDLWVNHFVYASLKDGYLGIFEKDFKRNYVHIRDVADCFLHSIDHAPRMVGWAYNVGLDAANLSKAELVMKVKEYLPSLYIHFSEVGSDPNKRSYLVSNQRLREAGFEAKQYLDKGIQELLKGYRMLVGLSVLGNV